MSETGPIEFPRTDGGVASPVFKIDYMNKVLPGNKTYWVTWSYGNDKGVFGKSGDVIKICPQGDWNSVTFLGTPKVINPHDRSVLFVSSDAGLTWTVGAILEQGNVIPTDGSSIYLSEIFSDNPGFPGLLRLDTPDKFDKQECQEKKEPHPHVPDSPETEKKQYVWIGIMTLSIILIILLLYFLFKS